MDAKYFYMVIAACCALFLVGYAESARSETYTVLQSDTDGVRSMTIEQGEGYAVIWTETDIGVQSELITITPDHDDSDVTIVPVYTD
ncbi:MAG: hypothetical protein DRI24_20025 [Deltaproteobacteria bacterium]|nr:MAG: hypothetical protein DRI24_20025 [Deltaproteobacteria bacterium]